MTIECVQSLYSVGDDIEMKEGKMGKKKTDLTQGNITLQLLQFGLPIVASMILQNLYNVADSLVVGRFIGDHALAAVGSTTSVSQFVLLLMGGATTGMGVIVSQYYGAGKEEEKNVKRAICTSFYIILMLAVVLGILGVLFSRQLLHGLMGVPEDVLEDSVLYLKIIFWGAVPTALYNMAFGISKALGDSVVPMLVLVVTCILNIGMNVLFVAGFSMGVAGVGYATVLATMISAVICILILWKKQTIIHPEKDTIAFDWTIARHMVKIGIPSALVTATISIGNMITQRFINGYGATVMAAYSAANKIEMLLAYTPGGLTGAMQFFTGQNVGAGNYDRVKQGYRAMMKIGLVYTAIAMTVMIVFRTPLIGIFSKEGGDMVLIGGQYLVVSAIGQIFLNITYMSKSTLIGAGDSMAPVYVGLLEMAGRIIGGVVLASFFGYLGVFAGLPIGWGLGMIYGVSRYMSGSWMKKRLVK